jgi:hypothetical protein
MLHAAQAPIIWLNAQDILSQRFIVSLTLPLKIATKTSSDQPSQLLIMGEHFFKEDNSNGSSLLSKKIE